MEEPIVKIKMNARLEPARSVEIIPCAIIHMEVFTAFALMDTEPPTTTRHLFPMMARTVQILMNVRSLGCVVTMQDV